MVQRAIKIVAVSFLCLAANVVATSTPDKSATPAVNPTTRVANTATENISNSPQQFLLQDESPKKEPSKPAVKAKSKKKRIAKTVAAEKQTKKFTGTKSTPSSVASTSLRRIKKEYKDAVQMGIAYDWVKGKPVKPTSKKSSSNDADTQQNPNIMCIGPLKANLRHWHFSFRGCGIYEAGIYHGRIMLPKDYPATPPRVQLWTPSGRFVPYADICLSASAYHPESWTPRWTVQTLVQALRLHMLTNPQEIGGMTSTVDETLEYARKSLTWELSWRAGKSVVSVDHAQLLQQKVLTTESTFDESAFVPQLPQTEENSPPHGSGESQVEVEEENSFISDDPMATETNGAVTNPAVAIDIELGAKPPTQQKNPKKSKSARKARRHGSVTTKQKARPNSSVKLRPIRAVLLFLAKLFSTPLRAGIVSLILLYWVTAFI